MKKVLQLTEHATTRMDDRINSIDNIDIEFLLSKAVTNYEENQCLNGVYRIENICFVIADYKVITLYLASDDTADFERLNNEWN